MCIIQCGLRPLTFVARTTRDSVAATSFSEASASYAAASSSAGEVTLGESNVGATEGDVKAKLLLILMMTRFKAALEKDGGRIGKT